MIEITLDTLALDAGAPDKTALDEGVKPEVHIQVVGGQLFPFADPNNPQRPMKVPACAVNFSLARKAAIEFADLVKAQAESLPEEKSSNIVTASSLAAVEQEAAIQKGLRGIA